MGLVIDNEFHKSISHSFIKSKKNNDFSKTHHCDVLFFAFSFFFFFFHEGVLCEECRVVRRGVGTSAFVAPEVCDERRTYFDCDCVRRRLCLFGGRGAERVELAAHAECTPCAHNNRAIDRAPAKRSACGVTVWCLRWSSRRKQQRCGANERCKEGTLKTFNLLMTFAANLSIQLQAHPL
jgi:hypothetical protein